MICTFVLLVTVPFTHNSQDKMFIFWFNTFFVQWHLEFQAEEERRAAMEVRWGFPMYYLCFVYLDAFFQLAFGVCVCVCVCVCVNAMLILIYLNVYYMINALCTYTLV